MNAPVVPPLTQTNERAGFRLRLLTEQEARTAAEWLLLALPIAYPTDR